MDLSLALKTAYFQALDPEIGVSVYDAFSIPERVSYPYVIISSIDVNEIVNSGCKSYQATVTLDIVTGFSSPTGMNTAWIIGENIESIINPNSRINLDLSANGYQMGQTRLTGSNALQLRTDNYYIYRNIRTYSHIIWSN
jgi:hypothetical protein